MWDYAGSHDDGDDELPLEVLQDNVKNMLDNTWRQSINQNNGEFGIESSSTTILENEYENIYY